MQSDGTDSSILAYAHRDTDRDRDGDFLGVLGIACFIGLLHINCLRDDISTPPFHILNVVKGEELKGIKMTDVMVNLPSDSWGSR